MCHEGELNKHGKLFQPPLLIRTLATESVLNDDDFIHLSPTTEESLNIMVEHMALQELTK